jgi:transposase
VIFVGIDWAERHHDVCLLDPDGQLLVAARLAEGVEGVGRLHALLGEHADEPAEVIVGIETDRGLLVGALLAAGYQVYAVNPLAASRYRERHTTSRAKSDRGDAKVLADLVRTDRHLHRHVAGDSPQAEAVKVLARAHQTLIWTRQRQTNQLRSALREFYPGALTALGAELANPQALAVLAAAPTPAQGRQLTQAQLAGLPGQAGRQRNLHRRAAELQQALTSPQLAAPAPVTAAYGQVVAATIAILAELNQQITTLEQELTKALRPTRTPRSCVVCPDSAWSSAPGCWRSSGMTRPATATLEHARPMRAPPRSPAPPAPGWSCWPEWLVTSGWPTPAACGPSAPFPAHQAPAPTTTSSAPRAPATSRPCARWATGWLASRTAACATAPATTSSAPGLTAPPYPQLDTNQPWDG